jgi:hypothetical protein
MPLAKYRIGNFLLELLVPEVPAKPKSPPPEGEKGQDPVGTVSALDSGVNALGPSDFGFSGGFLSRSASKSWEEFLILLPPNSVQDPSVLLPPSSAKCPSVPPTLNSKLTPPICL